MKRLREESSVSARGSRDHVLIVLEIPGYYCVIAITYGRPSPFIGGTSVLTITAIATDQYLAFHLRQRYREHVKRRRAVFILVAEWIFAVVSSII